MHVSKIDDHSVSVVNEDTQETSYVFWSDREDGLMKAYKDAEALCEKLNQ